MTNATAIGANAVVNASNKIRLGDVNVTLIEAQGDFHASGAGNGIILKSPDGLTCTTEYRQLGTARHDSRRVPLVLVLPAMPHLRIFNRDAAFLGDAFANPFASAIGVRLGLRICSRVLRCSLSGGFFISSGKRLSNQLSLAETRSRDWTRSWPGATLEQCPFFSLYWALCAPQSGRTGIWRLTEPSAQAATRPAPPPVEATTVRVAGSRLLGLALSALGRVARGAPHRSPRDGDSLASKGLPFVLDLEVRRGRTGRPRIGSELAELVRTVALANPLGARRASTAS